MLNPAVSLSAKKTGMQLSIMFDGEWTVAVLAELRAWLESRAAAGHRTMTFEQFRHDAIAQPGTHKAWGSLPAIACKVGLIAPMNHPDGSPVMRRAESVRTHAHHVRIWAIASFADAPAARPATSHDSQAPQAQRQEPALDGRGAVLHAGSGAELLGAVAAFHDEREAR